jgi:23S rRNA pseudouridine955/2504/2580 synthase
MNTLRKEPRISAGAASWAEVDEEEAGQRIDNFLIRLLKGVPKSHIYQLLRTGQVRVNSGRIEATYRLRRGDRVRLPPVRAAAPGPRALPTAGPAELRLSPHTLLEDDALLIIDKPAGVAAHGGSGISRGVIEQLRAERPELRFLELVHRLDRETSGVLLLAKKRSALTGVHAQIRAGEMKKSYLVLVRGRWRNEKQHVRVPLNKYLTADGERRVNVSDDGVPAHTVFGVATAIRITPCWAELLTGRASDPHAPAHLGFPLPGRQVRRFRPPEVCSARAQTHVPARCTRQFRHWSLVHDSGRGAAARRTASF